jgi:hypothetical protein
MVEVAKDQAQSWPAKFIFLSFATERALVHARAALAGPCRRALFGHAKRQAAPASRHDNSQLSPSPLFRDRHTPSSALLASRRPVQRTNRPSPLSNDTSHIHSPCLPISGESTPQLDLAGGKDGHHGQEESGKQTDASIRSTRPSQSAFMLTLRFSSPVYAVSATFHPLEHCCLRLITTRHRDREPISKAPSLRIASSVSG